MADLFTTLVPFLFVLAVVYGALDFTEIFKRNQVKVIISLSFAFVAMTNVAISQTIMGLFPLAIVAFIAFFFLGFVMKLFKGKEEKDLSLLIIVLILAALAITELGLGPFENALPSVSTQNLETGIGLVIILIIFVGVYKMWGGSGNQQ